MDMIFLIQGHCHLGVSKKDKDGNVTDQQAAQFVSDEKGPCIAVGTMDVFFHKLNSKIGDIIAVIK